MISYQDYLRRRKLMEENGHRVARNAAFEDIPNADLRRHQIPV